MTDTYRETVSAKIIATCLRMNALGVNQGTSGNVSARCKGGFLITPSGVAYEALNPGDIVFVTPDGDSHGSLAPSSEWRMHRDIYINRDDADAVVHIHPPHATALSCLREGIPAFHYMVAVAGGADIRCSDYATFGSSALSEVVLDALEGRRACLLANHGLIAYGTSLEKALGLAVEVEALAQQYLLVRQAGDPVLLSDKDMEKVLAKFATYGTQPNRER
ncbi:MAG: class II aldolase/adducin family protein [Proteobacteria bacterium]|nr:class II aldolase/adducin family protein [Pseudomonadota bacterium]